MTSRGTQQIKIHLQKVDGGLSRSQDSRKTMNLSGKTYISHINDPKGIGQGVIQIPIPLSCIFGTPYFDKSCGAEALEHYTCCQSSQEPFCFSWLFSGFCFLCNFPVQNYPNSLLSKQLQFPINRCCDRHHILVWVTGQFTQIR